MDELERNKRTLTRVYERLVNGRRLDLIEELFSPDVVEHEEFGDGYDGRDGFRHLFTGLFAGFSDYRMVVEDMIAEGDKVVARVTSTGTHDGPFLDIAPTGRRFEMTGIDIMRFRDGQVVEHWGVSDALGMLTQLGVH